MRFCYTGASSRGEPCTLKIPKRKKKGSEIRMDFMRKYPITEPVKSLVQATKDYESLVQEIRKNAESSQDTYSTVKSELQNLVEDDDRAGLATLSEGIENKCFDTLESNPYLVWDLMDELHTILSLLKDHATMLVNDKLREQKKDAVLPASTINEARELKKFIVNLFNLLQPMGQLPKSYSTKKSDKTGAIKPKLSNAPAPRNGATVGRGAVIQQARWKLDGEELPAGTHPVEISAKLLRIPFTEFRSALKAKNINFLKKDFPFEVEIQGHKLEAWLVESPLSESDDDEETEGNGNS